MPVLAHAGHWLVNLLYILPVVVIAVSIGVSVLRQRRGGDAEEGSGGAKGAEG